MDTNLRDAERAFNISPCVSTLERYANETIRAGMYTSELRRVDNGDEMGEPYTVVLDANGTIVDSFFNYCPTIVMHVMMILETQRRRNAGMSGPDCVALWMNVEDYTTPNTDWIRDGFVLD